MDREFRNPSNQFRAKPFWAWNGELEEEEIKRQVDVMEEMGFGGFFMHSRVGLVTDYLGGEWFDITNKCADYAAEKGLEGWLYDEDRWPSGSAGGKATVKSENRMKFIRAHEGTPVWDDGLIAAFSCRMEGLDIYDVRRIYGEESCCGDADGCIAGSGGPDNGREECCGGNGRVTLWFDLAEFPCAPGFNGTCYLDTMKESATAEFLRLTHEQYREKCGDRLGGSIRGIFTDEPHRGEVMVDMLLSGEDISAWTPYTDSLFADFERQWGYDLREKLPQLFYRENGEAVSQVKWHYCETVQELFLEHFMKPVARWCQENHMLFTGHMLHENTLSSQSIMNGSLMRSYELMDYPGVDVLGQRTTNYNIVKQLSSAARQTGKEWLLSELYGISGWQADFQDFKRIGDWQALLGINLRCPHLSWYTMAGQRKRDYPASIFYQSGWYQEYKYVEDYFARLGVFAHGTENVCDTLVINPVESMWCRIHKGWAKWLNAVSEDALALERKYKELYDRLLSDNVEFDYGDEEMLSRLGHVEEGVLHLGKGSYRHVIVYGMTTMRSSTYAMLRELERQGGKVVVLGELPEYVDALPAKVVLGNGSYEDILKTRAVSVGHEKIFSAVRRDGVGNWYIMLLNMDAESVSQGELTAPVGQCTQYFPETGESAAVEKPETVALQPGEMRLYRVEPDGGAKSGAGQRAGESDRAESLKSEVMEERRAGSAPGRIGAEELPGISLTESFLYETDEPNILVLDRAQCRYGDNCVEEEILRVDSRLRDACGIERRGGNMYQPWYQRQMGLKQYFPITLTYRFRSEIETGARLAMEQADRCRVALNGERIEKGDGRWIDPCMDLFEIHVRKGENVITVETVFADDTDLEAVYILGEFGVFGGVIKEKPERISFGDITGQGFPFYSGRLRYRFQQKIEECSLLKLPGLCGAACIKVNGKMVAWSPYEAVVEPCKEIAVELCLTRRNTFGPFHLYPPEKEASPRSYVTEGERWTDEMTVVPCGLYR